MCKYSVTRMVLLGWIGKRTTMLQPVSSLCPSPTCGRREMVPSFNHRVPTHPAFVCLPVCGEWPSRRGPCTRLPPCHCTAHSVPPSLGGACRHWGEAGGEHAEREKGTSGPHPLPAQWQLHVSPHVGHVQRRPARLPEEGPVRYRRLQLSLPSHSSHAHSCAWPSKKMC